MKIVYLKLLIALAILGELVSCHADHYPDRVYNAGINIIPVPATMMLGEGYFELNSKTRFVCTDDEARSVAEQYVEKISISTGFPLLVEKEGQKNVIRLKLDKECNLPEEGYRLSVDSSHVQVTAISKSGLFYGMATLMQLLPAEIESRSVVRPAKWHIPIAEIEDQPRFGYRGLMLDVARHFMPAEDLKRNIDMLASVKINRLHLHLTDYQGWRIEIKRYPRLTEVGAERIDEYGKVYRGYYTQEEMKELVAYASERNITIIPEIDVPGHSLAAIASYPELSCTGETYPVMSHWGPFPVVFCPGKEEMFHFIDDVFAELSEIFPSPYYHIGGDECQKTFWKNCRNCQQRIKDEHLIASEQATAEDRLQSYAIHRCEQILQKYGKKLIGWDEILQGGLTPNATVMSWRGERGGIEAALQNHQVIMTPNNAGYYLDFYQGDVLADHFAWGAYAPIEKTYAYDPVPDVLSQMGKASYVIGVQGNAWSECMFTVRDMEYQIYPRILAIAETGWSKAENKDFKDFSRRLENEAVRLDYRGINYHIPLPEQEGGSFRHLAFIDSVTVSFKSTRPVILRYTLDGTDPDETSAIYQKPLVLNHSGTIHICSELTSGKMSEVRTIEVEQQDWQPAVADLSTSLAQGLELKFSDEKCMYVKEIAGITECKDSILTELAHLPRLRTNIYKNTEYNVAIASGYVDIPADAIYQFISNNTQVKIDGHVVVDNDGRPQINSKYGRSMALKKGLHEIEVLQISNSIGGWNSTHRNRGEVWFTTGTYDERQSITPEMLFH